jgi:hypothetical protein
MIENDEDDGSKSIEMSKTKPVFSVADEARKRKNVSLFFKVFTKNMGVRQGVAMDSLKYPSGLPCPTLLCPAGGTPLKRPFQGVARPQVGHPKPYAYEEKQMLISMY